QVLSRTIDKYGFRFSSPERLLWIKENLGFPSNSCHLSLFCSKGGKMNHSSNRRVNLRPHASVLLFTLCVFLAVPVQTQQNEEPDSTRRLWNLQFRKARASNNATSPDKTKTPAKAEKKPDAPDPVDLIEGELLGVTIWRL